MAQYEVGDRIEHKLMPGFIMTIRAVDACETPDCQSVKIVDPEGNDDWLCTDDVQPAGPADPDAVNKGIRRVLNEEPRRQGP